MKNRTPHFIIGAIASVGLLTIASTDAAFIIQANGKAAANFVAGTAATNSTLAGAGTLLAPGLTPGVASVFGGEPYTYTYIPGGDGDNTTFGANATLNGNAGLFATGLPAGVAGIYNVYHVFPLTDNASGQPTLYSLLVNGSSLGVTIAMSSQNQNVNDLTTGSPDGVGVGHWELVGQVTVLDASDTVTVTVDTTTSAWVGARTAGVLFDYVGVPEPSFAVLLGLGAVALLGQRRR